MKIAYSMLIPILIFFCQAANAELKFGPRQKVPVVSSSSQNEVGLTVYALPDEQTEVMVYSKSGGAGYHDLWQSRRVGADGEWTRPVPLGRETSSSAYEDIPHVTPDGLTLLLDDGLWFDSVPHRAGGLGSGDIWIATRESTDDDFGPLENLGETINSRYYDGGATLSADGLTLFFDSQRRDGVGATDLWMATRDGPDRPWNVPVNLGETINSRQSDIHPAVSADGRRLFFSSDRSGNYDIWMSTRATSSDPWNAPVQLDENVNHPRYLEVSPTLSPDGSTLYVSANLSSTAIVLSWDVYASSILVMGDFDGNGLLTAGDLELLSEEIRAGTNDPALDLNADALVDTSDRDAWVHDLKSTYFGDANLDGEFNSGDLIAVFQAGKYEDSDPMNATWATGDWNGDADFDSGDLILAFQDGAFEQGPRAAVATVPEPSGLAIMLIAIVAFPSIRHRPRFNSSRRR